MIYRDMVQGSSEWLQTRCGRVTASRVADVVAKLKRKEGEAQVRVNYKAEIVCELLTGSAYEHYVSPAMELGTLNEPLARAAYEIECGVDVEQVGIAIHPTMPRFSASPDGLVGDDGMIEIKAPNTATHIDTLLNDAIPPEYAWQMLAGMACAERKWCDFVSFDPRLPVYLRLFIKRLDRDDQVIAAMEAEIMQFLAEVDEIIAKLDLLKGKAKKV